MYSLIRYFWRICTLILVFCAAYITTFVVFPYFDRRLPFFPAVLLGYGVLAYVLLPLVARFWNVVFKSDHIPRYAITPDGWPADPVNIAIVSKNKTHFVRVMRQAGWYTADKATVRNSLREAWAIIADKPYPTAPFSALYLFGRHFDLGFQQATTASGSPRRRHHVRFWRLDKPTKQDKKGHYRYWLQRFRHILLRRGHVWIGAAIEDSAIRGIRWRNLQLTHQNSSDHEAERDYIIRTLETINAVAKTETINDGEPFVMRGQNLGTTFIVTGKITVITLR